MINVSQDEPALTDLIHYTGHTTFRHPGIMACIVNTEQGMHGDDLARSLSLDDGMHGGDCINHDDSMRV